MNCASSSVHIRPTWMHSREHVKTGRGLHSHKCRSTFTFGTALIRVDGWTTASRHRGHRTQLSRNPASAGPLPWLVVAAAKSRGAPNSDIELRPLGVYD